MKIEVQDIERIEQNRKEYGDPLEHIKVASAYNSQIMVLDYRLKNRPKDISILDYTILAALEKQIPKKAKEIHCDEYICPECGSENLCSEYVVPDNYCPVCGQKLLIAEDPDDEE